MKNYLLNLPIRGKIFLCFIIAIAATTLSSGFFLETRVRKIIEAHITNELETSSSSILDAINSTASASIKNRLRGIAEKNFDITSYFYNLQINGKLSEKEAKEQASSVLLSQTIGKTGYIYCVDNTGVIKVHPEPSLHNKDISRFSFIKRQMSAKEGYLEYNWKNPSDLKERSKALYMVYFEPWNWIISVSSYRAEFKNLIDVADFRGSILNRRFGATGYSYLIDLKGNLILHPKLEGTNIFNYVDANGRMFIQELCQQKSGSIIYPWKNPDELVARNKLVIFNHIPEYDWIIASSSYIDEFYRPVTTIRIIIASITFLTLMIALLLSFWISSFITDPLKHLMTKLDLGAKGDLSVRMDVNTTEEIGKLAGYFNEFMDRLELHHRELDKLVKERTRDLEEEMAERIKVAEKLESHMELLETFRNTIASPVFYKDSNGVYLGCNTAFSSLILGVENDVIIGKALVDMNNIIADKKLSALHDRDMKRIQLGGSEKYEDTVRCADAVVRDFMFSVATFADHAGKTAGLAGVMMDLTEINKARQKIQEQADKINETNKRLAQLAALDGLTGISNRRTFQEQLDLQIRLSSRNDHTISLLLIDVDHFKSYNDTFGHTAGDEILKQLANTLDESTRSTDTVARYGGEEFTVILPNTEKKKALYMGKIFQKAIADKAWAHRDITVSIGIASEKFIISAASQSEDMMLLFVNKADKALYRSKETGRNCITHHDDIPPG
ncbi:MAG: diguanylate cyclase [Desulfobulbaceae bacterium]|nr:diguanylate cyclase [Desulfobulbaceae bacterium]